MQTQSSENFKYGQWLSSPPQGEEVVITGISGRFPASRNLEEFRNNIYNKKDMISKADKRWICKNEEIPKEAGIIPDLTLIDAGSFGIQYEQTKNLDPVLGNFLEVAIEAILDAGMNPKDLEGSKTGVFVGYSWSETEAILGDNTEKNRRYLTSCMRSFIPNRLSYFLKLKGPSVIIDTACSSSLNALELAFKAIRSGQCENALVGGCNLLLNPNLTLQFARFGVLSKFCRCKVFDQDASGYVRSETVACIVLQKSKNAKRIYSQIIHGKVNSDGFKEEGIHFPSMTMQTKLLEEVLLESGVSSSQFSYLEMHGTGTKVGDVVEVTALDNALLRTKTLLIGSVKSNLGHAEPGSGMASIIKAILAMEEDQVAPNINLKTVKPDLVPIYEKKFQVVTDVTPLPATQNYYIGVNNFGFGGNNCHVILKSMTKKRKFPDFDFPRLVCVSGRTEEAVRVILSGTKYNPELFTLFEQIFYKPISSHLYRGFGIFTKSGTKEVAFEPIVDKSVQFCINFGKFEISYTKLADYFMNFPVFKKTFLLVNDLISGQNGPILGQISFGLGLIETVKDLGLEPVATWDNSVGKLLSGYLEGSLTIKEVIEGSTNGIFPILKNPKLERYLKHLELNRNVPFGRNSVVLDVSDSGLGQNPDGFLSILGRLYLQGYDLDLRGLYPKVEFPVSRGTPMISPLVKWYQKSFYSTIYGDVKSGLDYNWVMDETTTYLDGHVIDGRNLFPATGYLNIVWEYLAKQLSMTTDYLPVVFENCKFVRATTISDNFLSFSVSVQKNGDFEVMANESVVVTGRVSIPETVNLTNLPRLDLENDPKMVLDESEIYKELHLRGYNYTGLFKGIVKCNVDGSAGLIRWENNWVSFMDKMLQMKILEMDSRLLYVPIGIRKILIDPRKHLEEQGPVMRVSSYRDCNVLKCGGIEISGLEASPISRRKATLEPVLETNIFIPNDFSTDLSQSIRINTQIILEESLDNNFKALELHDESSLDSFVMPLVFNALEDIPLVQPNLVISTKKEIEEIPGVKIEDHALSPSSNFLLIVGSKLLQSATVLNQVLAALSPNGFVLSRENLDYVVENSEKITILTQHCTKTEKLVLFRKRETSHREVIELSSDQFEWMSQLKQALKNQNETILYCQNREIEGILGFVNCLRREPDGRKIRCVFVMDQAPEFNPENGFYTQQIEKNLSFNVYKNGQWGTYRHLRLEDCTNSFREHSFISVTNRGDLSSMKWFEGPLSSKDNNKNIIYTHYCAINFRDVMTASGRITLSTERINQETIEGFEFSGKDSRGNRVMGMINNGALSTLIDSDPNLTWMVPPDWSLEEAATVPVVYSTVIYGLLMRSSLKPGTSILIHSGTGGVGLAALNVALAHQCQVFVTVGTKEKRDFLKKNYPQIPENRIGNSRDTSFKEMILKETRGRGVDVVLNSLAEEKLKISVQCLARGGKFMEIGKFDLVNNNSLQLLLLEKEASYHGIMLDQMFKEPEEVKLKLYEKFLEGVNKGYVKILPRTVFESDKVEAAFRFMTTGKHIGKVLVKIRDENQIESKEKSIHCLPKFWADSKKSYIILGGLGGFGLELADWLVLRGARNLLLTSRTGIQTGYQTQRIKIWQSYGARIHISTITISSKEDCVNLIEEASKLGVVDAIFNLAVILKDELFENQTEESFRISLTPKAFATKYLDEVSRDLCPNLRHFVVFSSVSCGRGNIGQTNYGMANSIMERICEKRKSEGFPALAIQWGAIGDVGLVAKMQKDNKELVIGGTLQQKISSCLNVLDRLLNQEEPIVSSMVVAEKRDKRIGGENPLDVVATLLGIKDMKTISQQSTLSELGMDSMMVNEILQTLEKEFEIFITPKELRNLTIAKLSELGNEKSTTIKQDQKTNQNLEQMLPENTTDPIIKLPSLVKPSEKAVKIFVLPGIEGALKLLEPLTKNLNAHVLGLQYIVQNCDTIRKIALELLPVIETNLEGNKQFCLLGYSFGAVIALELGLLLEEKNYSGSIISIDGSPHYIAKIFLQKISQETTREIGVLCHVLSHILPPTLIEQHKEKLSKCKNLDEKIVTALSLIPPESALYQKLDKENIRKLYDRCEAIANYSSTEKKLKSSVKLYRAEIPIIDIEPDYKLQNLCEEKVEIVTIQGDHSSILAQPELFQDINQLIKL